VLPERIHIQRGVRERIQAGLKRYPKYRTLVESTLRKHALPLELAALPLLESGYLNQARSRTGAAGLWQFMPGTARQFMRVDSRVDQRLNPSIATRSAARLLERNYAKLNSWPLAVLAYNHGAAGAARARDACGADISQLIACYQGKSFGYASMNFYAEFVAAVRLLEEHSKPAPLLARSHRVARGDTLTEISRRHRTTVKRIMSLNGLTNPNLLLVGQLLELR
jgi:membrane-bound lytic murein transglycosylase D